MRFQIGGWHAGNAAAENFGDDDGGVAGTVDAKISELVRNNALGVQAAEAGFIAEERAARHGHAAGKKDFDAGVEPDDGDAGVAEKFRGAGLRVGATAEGEDRWFLLFNGAAEGGTEFIGFQLTEGGLAVAFEKLRDGDAGGGFYAFVEIHEAPAEMLSQARADGAFAGAHESGETHNWNARERTARWERLIHDAGERGIDFITLDKEYSGGSWS